MSLSNMAKLNDPIRYTASEAAAAEVSAAETAEALSFTGQTLSPRWDYEASAEDNGTAGDLDGEPGWVYRGQATKAVSVTLVDMDISGGTITPEATDEVTIAVYKNSELQTYAQEGFVNELDGATHEMNLETVVDAVVTGDVIRIVLVGDGVETVDVDVATTGILVIDG